MCIVLTNSSLLGCDTCNYHSITTIPQGTTTSSTSKYATTNITSWNKLSPADNSYQGHYVVVCGYDLPRQKIIYRNPSLYDRECVMSFQMFEEARSCYGTDDDVIFVDTIPSTSSCTSSLNDSNRHNSKL